MRKYIDALALTPAQLAVVGAVFIVTAIGALVVALAFRWWNLR